MRAGTKKCSPEARPIQAVAHGPRAAESLIHLRRALGWSRSQLGHVLNCSGHVLATWEHGVPVSAVYEARLRQLTAVFDQLKELMKPRQIGPWLVAKNEEFRGRSAADLIRRGEAEQIWRSLFYLRAGLPD